METSEFAPIFLKYKSLHNLYKGSFSCDKTPTFLKTREFFICNTDTSDKPGRHWICFFKVSKTKIEVFNSLGANYEDKELYKKVCNKLSTITKVQFNVTQVQSSSSATCGHFCVYFVFKRAFNFDLSFDELLNDIFTDDLSENENRVSTFFSKL